MAVIGLAYAATRWIRGAGAKVNRTFARGSGARAGRTVDGQGTGRAFDDSSTARRQFKRHYGMTFQAYHRARRMGLALNQVRQGARVD